MALCGACCACSADQPLTVSAVTAQGKKADLFDTNELHGKLPKFVSLLKFKVSGPDAFM